MKKIAALFALATLVLTAAGCATQISVTKLSERTGALEERTGVLEEQIGQAKRHVARLDGLVQGSPRSVVAPVAPVAPKVAARAVPTFSAPQPPRVAASPVAAAVAPVPPADLTNDVAQLKREVKTIGFIVARHDEELAATPVPAAVQQIAAKPLPVSEPDFCWGGRNLSEELRGAEREVLFWQAEGQEACARRAQDRTEALKAFIAAERAKRP